MKKAALLVAVVTLAGCSTPSTMFVTPDGRLVRCAAHGWGYAGAPLANQVHDKCVSDIQTSGALPASIAGGIGVMPSAETTAVKILRVAMNSPADLAGIKAGDVITKIDNQPVTNWTDARRLLFGRSGTDVRVNVINEAGEKTMLLTRTLTVQNQQNVSQ